MPFVSPAEAASRLGISQQSMRERSRKHGKPARRPVAHGRGFEYWFDDDDVSPPEKGAGEAKPAKPNKPSARDEIGVDVDHAHLDALEAVEHFDDTGGRNAYQYVPKGVPNGDRYIFALKSKPGVTFVRTGDEIRSLIAAYSNEGSAATLNEIARRFGMHRKTVREIIVALGKTHDSAPFTDEEIAERDEDELAEDMIRLKEEKAILKAERKVWDQTKADALKAQNFDKFVAERLEQVIKTAGVPLLTPSPRRPSFLRSLKKAAPFSVMASPTDLHYGKNGWRIEVGQEFNRDICRKRLLSTAEEMIERVLRFGRPEKFILGAGSDWFHIDTKKGTTTAGTPQDTDGTWARIFLEGSELACEYVETLRGVAPVEIVCQSGNHDELASIMLTQWIAERYRGAKDVRVDRSPAKRHYLEVGKTLVGITHGDTAADNKLPALMAAEAREAWGRTLHRLWFTGHWHTAKSNEAFGVRVIHMPSLAGTDRWHNENGYVGNQKSLSAYLIDHEEGLIADLPVSARDVVEEKAAA